MFYFQFDKSMKKSVVYIRTKLPQVTQLELIVSSDLYRCLDHLFCERTRYFSTMKSKQKSLENNRVQ